MNSQELKEHWSKENPDFEEVFEKDGLDHEVYMDGNTLRWRPDETVRFAFDYADLNSFWAKFYKEGNTKNQKNVREMYRKLGYSVFGYWEVFFWDANNELTEEWKGEE